MIIFSDNAPNMLSLFTKTGNIAVGCPRHGIWNATKAALESCHFFKFIVNKCNRIVTTIKWNNEWKIALRWTQFEIYGTSMNVIAHLVTWWFSNLKVMERLFATSINFSSNWRKGFIDNDLTFIHNEKRLTFHFTIIHLINNGSSIRRVLFVWWITPSNKWYY